jgi:hypothetical protein
MSDKAVRPPLSADLVARSNRQTARGQQVYLEAATGMLLGFLPGLPLLLFGTLSFWLREGRHQPHHHWLPELGRSGL